MQRFKTKVGDLLAPGNNDPWPDVRDALNAFLFGWSRYFLAYFAGLDVSVKETSVCIVDDAGKSMREARVASEP